MFGLVFVFVLVVVGLVVGLLFRVMVGVCGCGGGSRVSSRVSG